MVPLEILVVAAAAGMVLPPLTHAYGLRDLSLFLLAGALAALSSVRPSFGVVTVVATFVFSALLRRLLPAAEPSVDLAAIVPFLVAVPLALHGLRQQKPVRLSLLLAWITLAAVLSFRTPLVGLGGWLNLAVPLLVAFAITRISGGLKTFARATVGCGTVAATYGIAQYFLPFSWDLAWLENTGFETAGRFGEASFRPFATLPAPLTAAMLCGVVILLVVFRQDLLRPSRLFHGYALATSTILLLLTQVRSVWVAVAAAFLVALLVNKGRTARRLAAPAVIVVLVLMLSPQGQVISERAQTLTDLESDVSYRARFGLLRQAGSLLSPVGGGLGSFSAGSRIRDDNSIDNGYLVLLGEVGIVGTALFLWALSSMVRNAQREDLPFIVVLVLANASALIVGNLPGLLLWPLVGVSSWGDACLDSDRPAQAS